MSQNKIKTRLKDGEKVIMVTRLHWFTMVVPVLITMAGIILGIVLGIVLERSGFLIGSIIILVVAAYFLYKLVERRNNIWAVTNLRIIDEFGVFSNNSKESPLDKINNVSYQQSFWGKIFGFGNVQIQTAAEVGATSYSFVEKPAELKDAITQMQEEYKSYQMKRQAAEMSGAMTAGSLADKMDVAAEVEKLFELKQRGILTEEEFRTRKAKLLRS
jgi:uncharacterized membrane protein YdbT with pleckstrin-like domain